MYTFIVVDYEKQRNVFVTKSAGLARKNLKIGCRIEVWGRFGLVDTIYERTVTKMRPYNELEREFRARKAAELAARMASMADEERISNGQNSGEL